ncbi:hypothetical protein EYD10_07868 [Varanus komodoensis]|nr:hypothetical protein EYD10_07868 [Varanus komodoensis]
MMAAGLDSNEKNQYFGFPANFQAPAKSGTFPLLQFKSVLYFLGLLVRGSTTNRSANLVGKKDFMPAIYGTSLSLSSFSHQTSHTCGLESNCSAEKKFNSPEDKIGTGGVLTSTFYKDHYKAAMEQLAALNLSKNSRTAQLNANRSRQGPFHSWSCAQNQGNTSVSKDLSKPLVEMPCGSSNASSNFINTNPLVHSFMKSYHPVSYPGSQKTTSENYCRNGDGDFFKKANEATTSESYPATHSSSDDMVSILKWHLKRGSGNGEDKLSVEEKDVSESEKSKALLKYFKNVNLNLKPEPIENKDGTSSSIERDTYSYPDFLPPPFNTLDLQKMSLSKWDDWKLSLNPPLDESLDKIISRLLEMERLQHLTILRERIKETVSPITCINNRTSSSKGVFQPKQSDISNTQADFDDFHSNGHCLKEADISKCTCQHYHNNKWSSGVSSSIHSSTKHSQTSCKCFKAPVTLESSNVGTQRSLSCSRSFSKIRSGVKMTPPKSLSPSTAVACPLPDHENSKCKQPRTKRKSCRKNGALTSKPLHSQKLKSLSFISKQKYSHVDQQ